MSNIKNLAKQTAWYGVSSIFGRFINYLLTPILTFMYASEEYGVVTIVYANIAFLNILFTYGMETAYFRYITKFDTEKVYNTTITSLLISTLIFSSLIYFNAGLIADFLEISAHPEYVKWFALIVAFDTLAVIPFARLRHESRPGKFAFIKILNIIINISLVLFFILYMPGIYQHDKGNLLNLIYDPAIGVGYVFIANLAASTLTILFLWGEIAKIKIRINFMVWKEMMIYSLPLLIVGFGGMINETIDRIMLPKLLEGDTSYKISETGIYGANYKLSILITLFIQAFRMGAEPFFFKKAGEQDAQKVYAKVMKYFVLVCCLCFLGVALFMDVWKYFIGVSAHPEYAQGLKIVPILLVANICLGIYYNLSIWYKVTNKTMTGAYITIMGALITIAFNWMFIPAFSYTASAWATLACYASMMVASYLLGQKYYPVPYAWKKLLAYIILVILIFFLYQGITSFITTTSIRLSLSAGLVLAFLLFALRIERNDLKNIPGFSRIFK